MTRIFCCGLALLFACSGDLTESGESPEARVVGFWAFSSAAVEPDPDVPRIDRTGEVRILDRCAVTSEPLSDVPCPSGLKAWYRLDGLRLIGAPPCDPAIVRVPEGTDSVIVIIQPDVPLARGELRGILRGRRLEGEWFGQIYSRMDGRFLLYHLERSMGGTEQCDS
jgi:hypothetical protein